jgi:hypothetical protein
MLSIVSKEFELMCFLMDQRILTGKCTFNTLVEKYGGSMVKKCMYEKKLIYLDRKYNNMEWTENGKKSMNF